VDIPLFDFERLASLKQTSEGGLVVGQVLWMCDVQDTEMQELLSAPANNRAVVIVDLEELPPEVHLSHASRSLPEQSAQLPVGTVGLRTG
jgi:hypothetical protein